MSWQRLNETYRFASTSLGTLAAHLYRLLDQRVSVSASTVVVLTFLPKTKPSAWKVHAGIGIKRSAASTTYSKT